MQALTRQTFSGRDGAVVVPAAIAWASSLVLALQEQSAARMLIWPWQLLYWLGPIAIGAGLLGLLLARRTTPAPGLPRPWSACLLAAGIALPVSSLLSPFRDQIIPWLAWPLAALAMVPLAARLLADPTDGAAWTRHMLIALGVSGALLSLSSLVMWAADYAAGAGDASQTITGHLRQILLLRNSQPLGHANYTSGSALLFLPVLAALAWTSDGWRRTGWTLSTGACLLMLFSGGSRGAFLGLVAICGLLFLLVWQSRRGARLGLCVAGIALLALAYQHPSVRGRLLPPPPDAPINTSNEERKTWLKAGFMAAAERPLIGWGTGASPWIMPRYRGGFDYGPYTILQLHSLPVQLLAEGGLAVTAPLGVLTLLLAARILRRLRRVTPERIRGDAAFWAASSALLGYGVFSLTDYQIDLPLIALSLSLLLAIAGTGEPTAALTPHDATVPTNGRSASRITAAALVALALLGVSAIAWRELRLRHALEHDDWPAAARIAPRDAALRLYVADRLLNAAREEKGNAPAYVGEALRLLRINSDAGLVREIGDTRLGWLLLEHDPLQAHHHFSLALSVAPNLLSAMLGSGLASLELGERERAEVELARACIAHPAFIGSGWWRTQRLAPLQIPVRKRLIAILSALSDDPRLRTGERARAHYIRSVTGWLNDEPDSLPKLITAAEAVSPSLHTFWARIQSPHLPPAPETLAPGLRAALAPQATDTHGRPPWISVVENALRRPLPPGTYATERELITQSTPAALVYSALAQAPDSPWPYHGTPTIRVGFPVNHRHPRLQNVGDGTIRIENLWSEHLLTGLWPDPYWLPNHLLKDLPGTPQD